MAENDFTGERYIPGVGGDIELEHVHRYLVARTLVAGKRVLDIACGDGYGAAILADVAAHVHGADVNAATVAHARRTYTAANLTFHTADAAAIPLDDGSIDVVVTFETIEHVADQNGMLREIRRVLAPGGLVMLSTPDRHEYSDVMHSDNPFHVRELYVAELDALLKEHFANHVLYGQRVQYASFLAPLGHGEARFVSYQNRNGRAVESPGLPNPVYVVALASDGALPQLPAGTYVPMVPPFVTDLTRLNDLATAAVTRSEHLQREVGLLEERSAHLVADLDRERMESDRASSSSADELRRRQQRVEALEHKLDGAWASEGELSAELIRVSAELSSAQIQIEHHEQATAAALAGPPAASPEGLELPAELSPEPTSESHGLTGPLRRGRVGGSSMCGRARAGVAAGGRRIYHAVPVPGHIKAPLKNATFALLAPVFRDTAPYAAWRASRGFSLGPERTAEPRALGPDSSATQADGHWEWADYDVVKARIAQHLAERASKARPKRRRVATIGREDPSAAAARIVLPAPTQTPDVSIVVPVYGHLKFTVECLLSIAAAGGDGLTFEVIVADDASADATFEALARVPNLRVVRQPQNVGFLRNCNAAAKEARGRLLVLLNNDASVRAGWLGAMARIFDNELNVGAVGPRVLYPNGMLQEAGTRINRDGSVEMIGLNESPDDPRWSYQRDVDYVSGACLMVETERFVGMGGFDESLAPAYCEDLELGLRLRQQGLRSIYTADAEIFHHLSVTQDGSSASSKMHLITRNMQQLAERYQDTWDQLDDVRLIAFYLPQFHRFPQNDLWWGRGFTEWTNVSRSRPNFVGHYQPRLPADLGYYDLEVPATMDQQWELASRYGVDAFCYYYYWFAGTRLLESPLNRLLEPGAMAHPFCLCWANENWTRRWDGQDNEILMAQRHSPDDDLAVIRDLARYLANPQYIRVRGRPLVLVYRVDQFPDFARTAERWREECSRLGIGEIHLAMVESFRFAVSGVDPERYGCDAIVEFPAHNIPYTKSPDGAIVNPSFAGAVADYRDVVVRKSTRPHPGHKLYRAVMPGWDNTARRQDNSFILEHSTPGAFQAWLETAIAETKRDLQGDDRLIFVNAWNEWAEGAYLEPDQRFGHTYLEAVRNARDADIQRSSHARARFS